MALVVTVLKTAIKAAQDKASKAKSVEEANDIFATELAAAIDNYIKSGDVNVNVTTTGGPTAQTGVGTGKII